MNKFIGFILLSLFAISCADNTPKSVDEGSNESTTQIIDYSAKGDSIATLATQILGGKLKSAMAEGGVPHALQFCSANALNITDSISGLGDFEISRVALKNRNPNNNLNEQEKQLFAQIESAHLSESDVKGELIEESGHQVYYKPIFVKGLCLACHGSEVQIGEENLRIITDLYPSDKATGFEMGDLRGFWKIKF